MLSYCFLSMLHLYFVNPHTHESANMIMDFAGRATNLDAPLKQGMVIMWPGFMNHGTRPNNTDNDRISVSFNTFCIDAIGSEQSLTHLDIRRLMNEHN